MATKKWALENREKMLVSRRKHYENNKQTYIDNHRNRKNRTRDWLNSYKETLSCSSCGESHISTLDFHHEDSSIKEFSISTAVNRGLSIEKIENEISKCIILCSNCHRKLHYEEKNGL